MLFSRGESILIIGIVENEIAYKLISSSRKFNLTISHSDYLKLTLNSLYIKESSESIAIKFRIVFPKSYCRVI